MKEIIKYLIVVVVILSLCSCIDNDSSRYEKKLKEVAAQEVTTNVEVSEGSNDLKGNINALCFEDPVVEERFKNALDIKNRPIYPSDIESIKCMRIDTDYGTGYEFSYDSYDYGDDISTFQWHKLYTLWDRKDTDWDNINNVKTWNDLQHFVNLEYLEMNTSDVVLNYMINKFDNLEPIGNLVNLKYFVFNKSIFNDLTPVSNCKKLQYLSIPGAEVTNLEFMNGFSELKEFTFNSQSNLPEDERLKDINGLAGCTKLEVLDLRFNEIEDISILGNLKSLKILDLSHNNITDFTPLQSAINLNTVDISYNPINGILDFKNNKSMKNIRIDEKYLNLIQNLDLGSIDSIN